jgi:hypothetical protein
LSAGLVPPRTYIHITQTQTLAAAEGSEYTPGRVSFLPPRHLHLNVSSGVQTLPSSGTILCRRQVSLSCIHRYHTRTYPAPAWLSLPTYTSLPASDISRYAALRPQPYPESGTVTHGPAPAGCRSWESPLARSPSCLDAARAAGTHSARRRRAVHTAEVVTPRRGEAGKLRTLRGRVQRTRQAE